MLHSLYSSVAPAVLMRLTLLLNHVLASEAVASERLRPHAGRRIEVKIDGWPTLLPAPPMLAFTVTPAGLLEWTGELLGVDPDLRLHVLVDNPALLAVRVLAGSMPVVDVEGNSKLASDVNWLFDNLRWDLEADLSRMFGPGVAHELTRFGALLAAGLRRAVRGLTATATATRDEAAQARDGK
jgi:ubiquinone biosynthesis accessory factor UbiJ